MWHYTDPAKTGFSLFAALTFVSFFCLTSFLFLCKTVRKCSLGPFPATALTLIEPILLLMAASPAFYDHPKARSILLGVGVLFLPLVYSYVFCTARCRPLVQINRRCCAELCKLSHGTRVAETPNLHIEEEHSPRVEYKPGSEILLAAFLTLSLRWCAGSINIFYSTWEAPLALLLCTLMVGLPKLITSLYETLAAAEDSKSRATSRLTETSSILSHSSEIKESPVGNRCDVEVKIPIQGDKDLKRGSCVKIEVESHKMRKDLKRGQKALVWVCAIVDGIAKGFLFNLFIWLFTSPAILRLWSGMEASSFGIIILVCFAVGTVIASGCSWECFPHGTITASGCLESKQVSNFPAI